MTVSGSLVTLPLDTVTDGADKVAPVTDRLTVISNGAPEATVTTTPPAGVVFSSVYRHGKGGTGVGVEPHLPQAAETGKHLGRQGGQVVAAEI